jgi:hypothetical protein
VRLILSKDANRVGVFLHSPEDGNRSSFRNVVFYNYLEFWTLDKVKKPSESEYITGIHESLQNLNSQSNQILNPREEPREKCDLLKRLDGKHRFLRYKRLLITRRYQYNDRFALCLFAQNGSGHRHVVFRKEKQTSQPRPRVFLPLDTNGCSLKILPL